MRNAILALGLIIVASAAWVWFGQPENVGVSIQDPVTTELADDAVYPEPSLVPAASGTSEQTASESVGNEAASSESALNESESIAQSDTDDEMPPDVQAYLNRTLLELQEVKSEPVDQEWAAAVSNTLRVEIEESLAVNPELRERLSVSSIDCRTTVCELTFLDNTFQSDFIDDQLSIMIRTLYADSWFEYFEEVGARTSTSENVVREIRQYFPRRTSDIEREQVDRYREPLRFFRATEE